jgi:hypothetical protein
LEMFRGFVDFIRMINMIIDWTKLQLNREGFQ